jgi:RNA polymerase-binding transcription factor DksA
MPRMTQSLDLGHFKERLVNERELLKKELQTVGTQDPSNPSDWIPRPPSDEEMGADDNDNADIMEEMGGRNAILGDLEGRLNQVVLALEKIEKGTYGVCEVTGEPIEVARLEANPAARTCKKHVNEVLA